MPAHGPDQDRGGSPPNREEFWFSGVEEGAFRLLDGGGLQRFWIVEGGWEPRRRSRMSWSSSASTASAPAARAPSPKDPARSRPASSRRLLAGFERISSSTSRRSFLDAVVSITIHSAPWTPVELAMSLREPVSDGGATRRVAGGIEGLASPFAEGAGSRMKP